MSPQLGLSLRGVRWEVVPVLLLILGLAALSGPEDLRAEGQSPGGGPPAAPQPGDLLKDAKLRREVANEQAALMVDEAIRRARQMVRTAPDDASELLKRSLDGIRNNLDISAKTRMALSDRLEQAISTISRIGARVKLKQIQEQVRKSRAPAKPETKPEPLPLKVPPPPPLEQLLPVPPKADPRIGPLLTDDLTQVPEVAFQQAPAKGVTAATTLKLLMEQMARIHKVNEKKTDGFMEALLARRSDLAGLPFVLGDACRTSRERNIHFADEIERVRFKRTENDAEGITPENDSDPDAFWERYQARCTEADKADKLSGKASGPGQPQVLPTRVAALMQIMGPEEGTKRLGLVKYLASVSHANATRALARLVLFSSDEEVRRAAVEALQVRREQDYTAILLQSFRYPWPAVAGRASAALVKLGRTDLVPRLIEVLEAPDPRAPVLKEIESKRVPVVRELVRVNHHRNCLLCHAPLEDSEGAPRNGSEVVGAIPIPGEPLLSALEYYSGAGRTVFVRVDVTYLRQDFSLLQPVADADPWPQMQQFDFLVRTRQISEEEARSFRDKLQPREPGVLSPYHRAALAALRELTGRDTEPTAQAWRRLLSQIATQQGSD